MARFVLTRQELRVIAFVVAAFIIGLAAKTYRDHHPIRAQATQAKDVYKAKSASASRSKSR